MGSAQNHPLADLVFYVTCVYQTTIQASKVSLWPGKGEKGVFSPLSTYPNFPHVAPPCFKVLLEVQLSQSLPSPLQLLTSDLRALAASGPCSKEHN